MDRRPPISSMRHILRDQKKRREALVKPSSEKNAAAAREE
jgi:hypothetical protein